MNLKWLNRDNKSERLLLIFSGWSVDSRLFERYIYPAGYDVAVIWDYRDLSCDLFSEFGTYSETVVIAWSFGVAAFNRIQDSIPVRLNINCAAAVNGTIYPVDNTRGIPVDIFSATLSGLSSTSLLGFQRRICGSGLRYKEYKESLCRESSDIEPLRQELEMYKSGMNMIETWRSNNDTDLWDHAFISEQDQIFPAANMKSAWDNGHTVISTLQGAHLPDFQFIFDTIVRDKRFIEHQFGKSAGSYEKNAPVQIHSARHLMELLNKTSAIKDILEIGSGSGVLTREIINMSPNATITRVDIATIPADDSIGPFICNDAEITVRDLLATESFDAILSANSVQWFHSPYRFLKNAIKLLKPGGYIAISTFGPGTLKEVTTETGAAALPYLTTNQWRKYAHEAGFRVLTIEEEEDNMHFDNGKDLISHLRKTGVNAISRSGGKTNFHTIKKLISQGECKLTFKPIYIILEK